METALIALQTSTASKVWLRKVSTSEAVGESQTSSSLSIADSRKEH